MTNRISYDSYLLHQFQTITNPTATSIEIPSKRCERKLSNPNHHGEEMESIYHCLLRGKPSGISLKSAVGTVASAITAIVVGPVYAKFKGVPDDIYLLVLVDEKSPREIDPLLKDLSEKKQSFQLKVVSLAVDLTSQQQSFARETHEEAEMRAKNMEEEEMFRLQKSLEERNGQLQASASTAEQISGFLEGEREYRNLKGDTSPLVYPAGFLYIYTAIQFVTGGQVYPAQIQVCFTCIGFFLVTLQPVAAKSRRNLEGKNNGSAGDADSLNFDADPLHAFIVMGVLMGLGCVLLFLLWLYRYLCAPFAPQVAGLSGIRVLDPRLVDSFPLCSYRVDGQVDHCPICLENFIEGGFVRMLPICSHTYHDDCIRKWLTTVKAHCPNCRHDYYVLQEQELPYLP